MKGPFSNLSPRSGLSRPNRPALHDRATRSVGEGFIEECSSRHLVADGRQTKDEPPDIRVLRQPYAFGCGHGVAALCLEQRLWIMGNRKDSVGWPRCAIS